MIDPKIGQIWFCRQTNDYYFVRRVSWMYIYYDVLTAGHISGSMTIDGFKYNCELYQ